MQGRLFAVAAASACVLACGAESGAPEVSADVSALLGSSGPLIVQDFPLAERVYQQESKNWWRWVLALPHSTGPITDQTGSSCGQGQDGPVWFFAGTGGGSAVRDCTIPQHKVLFFPLINHLLNPPEYLFEEPGSEADYQGFVDQYFPERRANTCRLELRLDGVSLLSSLEQADGDLWTEELDPFYVYLNADNYASEFGLEGGHYHHATEGGHFALLLPPSPGTHTLEFGGTTCFEDGTTEFEVSTVFNLTVE